MELHCGNARGNQCKGRIWPALGLNRPRAFLPDIDLMGVIAVRIPAAGSLVAVLIAPRVTGVLGPVRHGPRVHVAGKSSAKRAHQCQPHLHEHRLGAGLHPVHRVSDAEASRNSRLATAVSPGVNFRELRPE